MVSTNALSHAAVLLMASGLLLAGCVKNPVTGTRELSLLSADDERRMGEQAARQVEATVGLLNDDRITPYVRSVGARLAALSPRQGMNYQFDIVDMVEPNAFALPDGHIYVSRGILALSNREDELAGILGHEIGHVAARHANQRFSRAAPVGVLAGITSAVVGVVSTSAANSIAGLGAGLNEVLLAPHSRDQERQADQVGQDLAAKGGWNPLGLTDALDSLGRMDRYTRGDHKASWLDSHPATAERVAETRAHAQALSIAKGHPTSRDDYVRRLKGLLLGANAAFGAFEDNRFVHPELGFTILYPKGWTTDHSRQLVLGQSPAQDALCVLGAQGRGSSPLEAARQFSETIEANYTSGPTEQVINGNPAARARLVTRDLDATLVFVAYEGITFQLLAFTQPAKYSSYAQTFEAWLTSFGAASADEIAGVSELRLAIVEAEAGDTLDGVLQRYPNGVDPKLVAILNGMTDPSAALPGQALKLPVLVQYTPSR